MVSLVEQAINLIFHQFNCTTAAPIPLPTVACKPKAVETYLSSTISTINLTVIIVKRIVDRPLNTNTATIKFGLGNVAYQTKLTIDMAHAKSMICLYVELLNNKVSCKYCRYFTYVANNWDVPTYDAVPPTDLINTEI